VHVAELFDALTLGPDVEIEEAVLPDFSRCLGPQRVLSHALRLSRLAQYLVGKALLQHLHHHRRRGILRFANQQMEVFRHDYIAEHDKAVASPYFFQKVEQQVAAAGDAQQGEPAVTTAGDEVQIAGAV
jgi:hypothetical protein